MAVGITLGATTAWQTVGFGTQTMTVTNLNGGSAFLAGSTVVLVVSFIGQDGQTLSAITLNGQPMTNVNTVGNAGTEPCDVGIWYIDLLSNQTDSCVLTDSNFAVSGGFWRGAIVTARALTGAATGGPTANSGRYNSGANPMNLAAGINLPSGGIGIAALMAASPGYSTTTWSATGNSAITASGGDFQIDNGGATRRAFDGHSTTANAAWNPSASDASFGLGPGSGPAIVAATWAQTATIVTLQSQICM